MIHIQWAYLYVEIKLKNTKTWTIYVKIDEIEKKIYDHTNTKYDFLFCCIFDINNSQDKHGVRNLKFKNQYFI